MTTATTYTKEVNWPSHTATLRKATRAHTCCISHRTIGKGEKVYVIVTWNAGLAGKKFPDYVSPECLEKYQALYSGRVI
jgi:hypothetical protein